MLDADVARDIADLLHNRTVASLATLQVPDGAPAVSMTPFAYVPTGAFVIHVSTLAQHTRNMETDPRVSLLVTQPDEAGTMPQALSRLMVQGRARRLVEGTPEHADARRHYVGRFPSSEPMMDFGDFGLFAITPLDARFVAGFARAFDVSPEELRQAVAGVSQT
jgi:putative heme iron utilization protein